MDSETLERVMLEAKSEINQIERQLVALTARRDLLWKFITSSQDLIQAESGKSPNVGLVAASSVLQSSAAINHTLVAPAPSSVSLPTNRIWEAVQLVMGVAKRPLTVPEIVDLLERHKIIIGGEFPRENVRTAMARKEDIFEKLEDRRGFYVLREWPDSIKQLRGDEHLQAEVA